MPDQSGFSFNVPDRTGFFYSLITLYTILEQSSSFRDRRNKILFHKIHFVRKIYNFYFVRKMLQGRPLYHTKVLKFPKPTRPTPKSDRPAPPQHDRATNHTEK